MNKVDWKQKLSSRKFWVAMVAYVTSILTAFNIGDNVIAQVSAILGGLGALAVYILAESKVDASRANGGTILTEVHEIKTGIEVTEEQEKGE